VWLRCIFLRNSTQISLYWHFPKFNMAPADNLNFHLEWNWYGQPCWSSGTWWCVKFGLNISYNTRDWCTFVPDVRSWTSRELTSRLQFRFLVTWSSPYGRQQCWEWFKIIWFEIVILNHSCDFWFWFKITSKVLIFDFDFESFHKWFLIFPFKKKITLCLRHRFSSLNS